MSDKLNEPENRFGRISDLDDSDKPREKALAQGIRSLSNAELLAIVFGSGLPGKSVIQLSQEILGSCNNRLSRLSRMSIHEVVNKYNGIGPAKAISLAAAFELGCRCRDEEVTDDPMIRQSSDVYNIMRNRLERLNYEEFWILMLSRSNRVISEERLSQGGTASTVVDIKLLLKSVIDKLASGIILVHNHPSGNCNPSNEDDRLTHRIKEAATLLDIKLFDHIIITPNSYYSYTDNSRL
ncbi:MAG: DNA repair protein RadC [Muribaculaceae bacterium]|nr:DNA repair protein RadC [Muribaculaceae bacterium]